MWPSLERLRLTRQVIASGLGTVRRREEWGRPWIKSKKLDFFLRSLSRTVSVAKGTKIRREAGVYLGHDARPTSAPLPHLQGDGCHVACTVECQIRKGHLVAEWAVGEEGMAQSVQNTTPKPLGKSMGRDDPSMPRNGNRWFLWLPRLFHWTRFVGIVTCG